MRRFALIAALAFCSCEPMCTDWPATEDFPVLTKDGATVPDAPDPLHLKVMTWNVKYGAARIDFWFDYWGDRTEMTIDEVQHDMEGIYALINEIQPDILTTNEIEIDSKRSAYVDMVQGILDNTSLQYAAYVPTWDDRYVPTEGVGRMNMGNCVFSRFPIVKNTRIAQTDRTDQDALTKSFYLHRAVGRAVLQVGDRQLAVFTVHTEAYDEDRTNHKQQQQIFDLMAAEELSFVMAGDLNALMPTSVKFSHFNDESPKAIGTSFEDPPYDLDDLKPFFWNYNDAIGLDRYGTTEAEQRRWYSHSIIGPDTIGSNGEPGFWTRRLDYLFIKPDERWGDADVLQTAGRGAGPGSTVTASGEGIVSEPLYLSDHCPVAGIWKVTP
jgi:endonuclease/exonuclease/phosphatase family metal-dependent hydrolase